MNRGWPTAVSYHKGETGPRQNNDSISIATLAVCDLPDLGIWENVLLRDFREVMATVFTPSSPVSRRDLLRGRSEEVGQLIDAISIPGMHVLLTGDHGTGKTSIVNIMPELINEQLMIKVCDDGAGRYRTIWSKVLQRAPMVQREKSSGLTIDPTMINQRLIAFFNGDGAFELSEILHYLRLIPNRGVIGFDDVDDPKVVPFLSNFLRALSDNNSGLSVVIASRSPEVASRLATDAAIRHSLTQIKLGRLTDKDAGEVLAKGFERLQLAIEPSMIERLSKLAAGQPGLVNLIGFQVARQCFRREQATIDQSIVSRGFLDQLLQSLIQSTPIPTHLAASGTATKTQQVAQAAAWVDSARLDSFGEAELKGAEKLLFGKELPASDRASELERLSDPAGQAILARSGDQFRFVEPYHVAILRMMSAKLS